MLVALVVLATAQLIFLRMLSATTRTMYDWRSKAEFSSAWLLMRTRTETDLTAMNFCWAARVLVKSNPKTVNADVLPGELIVTSDGTAYRTVDRKAAYTLLRSYSPFVL